MKPETKMEAKIGDGVTMLGWTDRYPGTVIKVTKTTITVQEDIATRIDRNGMHGHQVYTYKGNRQGRIYVFRKTRKGYYRSSSGFGLIVGQRDKYYDYAF